MQWFTRTRRNLSDTHQYAHGQHTSHGFKGKRRKGISNRFVPMLLRTLPDAHVIAITALAARSSVFGSQPSSRALATSKNRPRPSSWRQAREQVGRTVRRPGRREGPARHRGPGALFLAVDLAPVALHVLGVPRPSLTEHMRTSPDQLGPDPRPPRHRRCTRCRSPARRPVNFFGPNGPWFLLRKQASLPRLSHMGGNIVIARSAKNMSRFGKL
jgi:hypothetical protein